jgi:hypothetical protein
MNAVAAFFLGILLVFIILIPFWLLANTNPSINTLYKNSIAYGVCEYTGTPAIGGNIQTKNSVL